MHITITANVDNVDVTRDEFEREARDILTDVANSYGVTVRDLTVTLTD
jgi:hypothetical protein